MASKKKAKKKKGLTPEQKQKRQKTFAAIGAINTLLDRYPVISANEDFSNISINS